MRFMPTPSAPSITLNLLVHRPGRMVAIAVGTMLFVAGALLVALQRWGDAAPNKWTLLLMVPAIVGVVAIMRTGTTRCEVVLEDRQLLVRSMDASQLLGRAREAVYTWADVRAVAWVGDNHDELRLDFRITPRALVFSGAKRDLEILTQATKDRGGRPA